VRLTLAVALLATLTVAVGASAAGAAPTIDEFEIPLDAPTDTPAAQDITQSPDGNLWFVERGTNKIGKVVPGNPPVITHFATPGGITQPQNITVGPDGHLWFSGGNSVGEVPPNDPTNGEAHGGLGLVDPRGLATGPDGNIWVADRGNDDVKRVDTTGAAVGSTPIALGAGCQPQNITRGPDNNMWVTCFGNQKIVRIKGDASAVDPFTTDPGNVLIDIVAGPDGNLWFTGQLHNVGRITTAGSPQNFVSKGLDPFGITVGPDGALWYAEAGESKIGRVDTSGNTSEFGGVTPNSMPRYITPGPGNTLWFTEDMVNKIGRVSGIVSPGGGAQKDTKAPVVTGVRMSTTKVLVGKDRTPVKITRKTGTTISYSLSEAARVSLRIERALSGRKSGKRCVKPKRSLRHKKKCTRYKRSGTLTRSGKKGKNRHHFSGRIGKKALKVGRYRLSILATDAAGNKAKPKRKAFRIVKPPKRHR
jgi:streptogramin lyase